MILKKILKLSINYYSPFFLNIFLQIYQLKFINNLNKLQLNQMA